MTSARPWLRSLSSLVLGAGLFLLPDSRAGGSGQAAPPPGDPAASLAAASGRVDKALARADLAAYRGWLKYLRFDAETVAQRSGVASAAAIAKESRLDDWLMRIEANPKLLDNLSGVQEWAYESPVDNSGQPFRIAIPSDYDRFRPAPLTVYMHGYSGNQIEHSEGFASHPGSFDIAVLGRSRGGGYRALSEADVLQAVDYVQAHWAVDPDRVSLNGGSMGGGATYRLGSRYPQRWSSGRPSCGYGSYMPMGNLITLPIYATHSADDPTVSVLHDRGPLALLRELGGQVIYDETNGFGHAVWNYKEGNARGLAWEKLQARPNSRTVRHVDYTALDGGATRGWWAEICEWGPSPRPARFVLTAGRPNLLHAELTNITRLRLRLAESPFDDSQPLQVSVNGAIPFTLPSPLPSSAVIAFSGKGWGFEGAASEPVFRLHAPGAASLLYDGEPLLIVYGTKGSVAEQGAMRAAAEAASKSPIPAWPDDGGDKGVDGVPHSHNLYGQLATKADADVTDADLARCHVVLIGTSAENSVVARIADKLPVRLGEGAVTCSDGVIFPGKGLALGLVYFNPLAEDRLIFWVASNDPAAYAAGSAIPLVMAGGGSISGNAFTADLLVMPGGTGTLVGSRSFDSRWRWTAGHAESPLVSASIRSSRDFSVAVGSAVRRAAGADAALVGMYGPSDAPAFSAGVTRVRDVAPLFANLPVGVFEVSGSELIEIARRVSGKDSGLMLADFDAATIVAGRSYRVALPVSVLWAFSAAVQPAPGTYRITGVDTGDAVERFLPTQKD
jgi:hypothetical protein